MGNHDEMNKWQPCDMTRVQQQQYKASLSNILDNSIKTLGVNNNKLGKEKKKQNLTPQNNNKT